MKTYKIDNFEFTFDKSKPDWESATQKTEEFYKQLSETMTSILKTSNSLYEMLAASLEKNDSFLIVWLASLGVRYLAEKHCNRDYLAEIIDRVRYEKNI